MPRPTRTDPSTGETREWDGGAWVPMGTAAPAPTGAPADAAPVRGETGDYWTGALAGGANEMADRARRYVGSFLQGLNPLNTVRALWHPVNAAENLVQGAKDVAANPTEALMSPELWGNLAGGIAQGRMLPPVVSGMANAAPGVVRTVGKGMEALGASKPVQVGAVVNAAMRPSLTSLAELAIPPALEYGGKALQGLPGAASRGMQKLSDVIDSLRDTSEVVNAGTRATRGMAPEGTRVPQDTGVTAGAVSGLDNASVAPVGAPSATAEAPASYAAPELNVMRAEAAPAGEGNANWGTSEQQVEPTHDDLTAILEGLRNSPSSANWTRRSAAPPPASAPTPWQQDIVRATRASRAPKSGLQ